MPDPEPLSNPTTPPGRRWATTALFALICLTPLFYSLGDHPLHGDSEARYATIARAMLHGQSPWLIPHHFDNVHITKPPLAYWLMACSMKLLGPTELAARMPAALAGLGTLITVFVLARRFHSQRIAFIATALAALCPMFLAISRMAITDGPLGFCCLLALAAGLFAVYEQRLSAVALLWAATAAGLCLKGPAALLPIGALFIWLAAAGRWREWRSLRPLIGLPLALAPLLAWALYLSVTLDDPWAVWHHETIDRAAGTGDHPEPWWFFLPVFLVGLLPATAMLPVPGLSIPAGSIARHLHRASPEALWLAMICFTFLVFTLITGKLMSYMMPLVGPTALLAAPIVARWIDAPARSRPDRRWGPSPMLPAVLLSAGMTATAVMLHRSLGPGPALWLTPLLVLGLTAAVIGPLTIRRPMLRRRGVLLLTILLAGIALWAEHIEDVIFTTHSSRDVAAEVRQATGLDHPHILTVGYIDRPLAFYTNQPTGRIDPRYPPEVWAELRKDNLVMLAEPDAWGHFAQTPPGLLDRWYTPVGTPIAWGWPARTLHIYRVRPEFYEPPQDAGVQPR